MSSSWKPCVVIPVYNHEAAIGQVVAQLRPSGLPILLVNDGSNEACSAVLRQLADAHSEVELLELPENHGKGGAVKAGMRRALERGFSHALQLDADGQHAIADLPAFFELGQTAPDELISGLPIYGEDVPASRLYGRYITHVWVWINTLSLQIRDSMCGFRLYPLAQTVELFDAERIGSRMDFDTEILVHWVWRGGRVRHIPTRVSYPADGISHFDLWRDNVLISRMHARLFFGMLWRLPFLLRQRFRRAH